MASKQHPAAANWRERLRTELYDNVLPFWMNHSLDHEFGGYFNNLDRDGTVYDTKKNVWLQGRQVWMFSRIHNTLHGPGGNSEWLEAARLGADFLRRHARFGDQKQRVYFALTRDGQPAFSQRKMFSECFYVMAMAEYARAAQDDSARAEAREMFGHVLRYSKDPTLLGRPAFPALPAASELAVPMILLNLIEEVNDPGETGYEDVAAWCVERIGVHYRPELKLILETVGADGNLLDTPEGRLVNPGHAIECGWFLLAYARKTGNDDLKRKALDMIDWSWDFGWDKEEGGLFYFLDRKGFSPIQLEWSMKLWWPHCEAMVAFLMAWQETGEEGYWKLFQKVANYSLDNFSDPEHGEWFGYLDRRNQLAMRFKGGPYKGCFHVPRALFLCEQMLARAAS